MDAVLINLFAETILIALYQFANKPADLYTACIFRVFHLTIRQPVTMIT